MKRCSLIFLALILALSLFGVACADAAVPPNETATAAPGAAAPAESATMAPAEVYTNPDAGYSFTVPDGWAAIDAQNAQTTQKDFLDGAGLSASLAATFEQYKDMPFALLLEKNAAYTTFGNNINIIVQDLGQAMDVSSFLPFQSTFEQSIQATYPDYVTTVPLALVQIGPWQTASMSGTYTQNGVKLVNNQVMITSGVKLYVITLTAAADEAAKYGEVLNGLVASFAAPQA